MASPFDFFPSRESELKNWSDNFSTKISAAPTTYGLTAGQATTFAALNTTWVDAYNVTVDPTTRTRGTIAAKNTAKRAMMDNARLLSALVQATPTVTDQQKIDLGLNVRATPSPINPPTECPVLEVVATNGRVMQIALRSMDSARRGKPKGVAGATVFSYVGATPPADMSSWKYEGETTRTNFEILFAPTVPAGSQVWLTAFWKNPRNMSGPLCAPVSAYIAGGVTSMAA